MLQYFVKMKSQPTIAHVFMCVCVGVVVDFEKTTVQPTTTSSFELASPQTLVHSTLTFVCTVNLTLFLSLNASEMSTSRDVSVFKSTVSDF